MSQSNKNIFIAELAAVIFMAVCLILFLGRLFTEPQEQLNFKPVTKPPVIDPSPARLTDLREWTSVDGKKVNTRFLEYKDGKIRFRKDGKIKSTSPSNLSQADIDFLKSHGVPLP